MTWAYAQKMKSSVKFVLVTLCDYADAEYRLWPSIADLVEKTCMDRKTVMSAIAELEENGYLVDTGERTGKTRQVKVYFVNVNGTGNGTVKEYQKRNSTENGTVPFFPSKGTVFPTKEYQISHERVPNLVHGTIKEPLKNHQGTVRECAREPEPVDNPKPPDKPAKRKTRLPENWFLPKDWGSWALEQGLTESEIRTEAECFADYWRSKGETRADWQATWRNWIRRSKTFSRSKVPRRETISERNARIEREIFGARANDEARTIDMETAA